MKGVLLGILKYMKLVLIVTAVISIIIVIISKIFDLTMFVIFRYAAIISFILAFLSFSGNSRMASSPFFARAQSVTSRSVYKSSRENMNLRDSSYGFLIFMIFTGILLMIISNILLRLRL